MKTKSEGAETGPSLLANALQVSGLSALAIAEPIFDLLSRHADFFVARRSQPHDIILLTIALILLPPIPLLLLDAAGRFLRPQLRHGMHGLIVGSLLTLIALPALGRATGLPGGIVIPAVMLAAVTASVYLLRYAIAHQYLNLLALSVVAVPALFLFRAPISRLAFPSHVRVGSAGPIDKATPIAMVIFDEFPLSSLLNGEHRIDSLNFPNFDALAEDATWYRNATTVSDQTLKAVPAILTGNYPERNRVATAADHPENIFTLLEGSYRFKIFEDYTSLCPATICERLTKRENLPARMASLLSDLSLVYLHLLLPPDLREKLPPIALRWRGFMDDKKTRWASQTAGIKSMVEAITPQSKKTLFFVHAALPHGPYRWYPSGKSYVHTGGNPAGDSWQIWGSWPDDEWIVVQSYQRHLLQVAFVDKLLGDIVARLKNANLYDASLIVITADHGCSFRPQDARRKLTQNNFADIMSVPLLIKKPFQEQGRISDEPVETIDIVPTIADVLGIDLPWSVDGRSASDASIPARNEKTCVVNGKPLKFPVARFDQKYRAVDNMLNAFGSTPGRSRFYRIGSYAEDLVGRRVADLDVLSSAGVDVQLISKERFRNVDVEADALPGEIAGFVSSPVPIEASIRLAVAVNGIVRATTQTYKTGSSRTSAAWSALVDEKTFQSGENNVEVFVISKPGDHLALRRTGNFSGSPLLDINLAFAGVPGVKVRGFQSIDEWGRQGRVRWSMKRAVVTAPISGDVLPGALKIDLLWEGPRETSFRVLVNGRELLHKIYPGRRWPVARWSETLSLSAIPLTNRISIELVTENASKEPLAGDRPRGVAVGGIWLLRSMPSSGTEVKSAGDPTEGEVIFSDGFENRSLGAWTVTGKPGPPGARVGVPQTIIRR